MKIMKLAALAAATCFASPAFADDLSGFRLEGRIGWESGHARTEYPAEVQIPENDLLVISESRSGITYGLEAGYDAMVGDRVLLGAYAGFDLSDYESCDEIFGDDLGCIELGRNITAGVRAGYAVSPTFLLYAKGGYSNGRVSFAYDSDIDEEDVLDADVAERSRSTDGYHLGAGAEVAFSRNFYGKLEYVFTDYGSVRFLGVEDGQPDAFTSARRHQALAGVGVRF